MFGSNVCLVFLIWCQVLSLSAAENEETTGDHVIGLRSGTLLKVPGHSPGADWDTEIKGATANGQITASGDRFHQEQLFEELKNYKFVFPQVLSGKQKRSVDVLPQRSYPNQISISVELEGEDLTLDLRRNKVLLPRGFQVSYYDSNGTLVTEKDTELYHCYYEGSVRRFPESQVSASTCSGLSALIVFSNQTYIIEHLKGEKLGRHLLYRPEDLKAEPSRCGVTNSSPELTLTEHLQRSQRIKRDVLQEIKHLELVLVTDNGMYLRQGNNRDAVLERTLQAANAVDMMFRPFKIRIALIGVEIWTTDQILVDRDVWGTLTRFLHWRESNLLPRMPNDSAHLLRGGYFHAGLVGLANFAGICSKVESGGIASDYRPAVSFLSTTLAHGLAHNLGVAHDIQERRCSCSARRHECIMHRSLKSNLPRSLYPMNAVQEFCALCALRTVCIPVDIRIEIPNYDCPIIPPTIPIFFQGFIFFQPPRPYVCFLFPLSSSHNFTSSRMLQSESIRSSRAVYSVASGRMASNQRTQILLISLPSLARGSIVFIVYPNPWEQLLSPHLGIELMPISGSRDEIWSQVDQWYLGNFTHCQLDASDRALLEQLTSRAFSPGAQPRCYQSPLNINNMLMDGAMMKMFADDTKIGCVVDSVEDNGRLQEDIDGLVRWAEKWLVSGLKGLSYNERLSTLCLEFRRMKGDLIETYKILKGLDREDTERNQGIWRVSGKVELRLRISHDHIERYRSVTIFSNCSRQDLERSLLQGIGWCLFNKPNLENLATGSSCGNLYVEEGEECDCGSPQECTDTCCEALICALKPGAKCSAAGVCCNNCEFLPKGTACRPSREECDLPEFCTGNSPDCPDDVFRKDGHPCSNGSLYCTHGTCQSVDKQCKEIWGDGATSADEICYEVANKIGNRFGHCGKNIDEQFVPCDEEDKMCGKIQCQDGNPEPYIGNRVEAIGLTGAEFYCVGKSYGSRDSNSLDLVRHGTKCGENLVCFNTRCQRDTVFGLEECDSKCHKRGVCNNKGNCHCDDGWAPPYCASTGEGGSIDSGNWNDTDTDKTPKRMGLARAASNNTTPATVSGTTKNVTSITTGQISTVTPVTETTMISLHSQSYLTTH
ncbi:disintegrin and metalloproteinase domain-containing protein 12-like [Heterodontus francisci]|uniref:disintegrin and metalloproteinase domain-containing protein 12-like n=1 Tax=Heterodontus francisci TaxID=7792 RepID=UPI00355B5611